MKKIEQLEEEIQRLVVLGEYRLEEDETLDELIHFEGWLDALELVTDKIKEVWGWTNVKYNKR